MKKIMNFVLVEGADLCFTANFSGTDMSTPLRELSLLCTTD